VIFLKARLRASGRIGSSIDFFTRNVTLGVSLFLPSLMPASNQPPLTSTIWTAFLTSTGEPQPEAPARARPSTARTGQTRAFIGEL
jgi:hypothetical protein